VGRGGFNQIEEASSERREGFDSSAPTTNTPTQTRRVGADAPSTSSVVHEQENSKEENPDNVKFYFTKPHQPWQRDTNENTNGLLRDYFPKGKDITGIPNDYILAVMCEMNLRPRRVLEYQKPYEVFFDQSLHLV
jgi:hypothetical protein